MNQKIIILNFQKLDNKNDEKEKIPHKNQSKNEENYGNKVKSIYFQRSSKGGIESKMSDPVKNFKSQPVQENFSKTHDHHVSIGCLFYIFSVLLT